MMVEQFDLIVVGAGPGGYVASIRAAQLGMKVAVIEKDRVGGTCFNVGCIQSKLLIEHGKRVYEMNQAKDWGIFANHIELDINKMNHRKDEVVDEIIGNVHHLFDENHVNYIQGEAVVHSDLSVEVNGRVLHANDIVLATGSSPFVPPIEGVGKIDYETTDSFFKHSTLPEQITIVGGGVIATELASAMADLSVHVTILESGDNILRSEDKDVQASIRKLLDHQGVKIVTHARVNKVDTDAVYLENGSQLLYGTLLFATGRRPNLQAFESLNLTMEDKTIKVNEFNETSVPHVYAIGDLVAGYQLAHTASAHGAVVAEKIAGLNPDPVKQEDIPRCIYTRVESASIGLSEAQAIAQGYDVKVTQSNFKEAPKALIKGETNGVIKMVIDKATHHILGIFAAGPNATDVVGQMSAMRAAHGQLEDLAAMIQPHPALSETIGETANAYFNKAIHQ